MTGFSMVDVLALPPLERELLLYLTRNGAADATMLAAATGRDEAAVRTALTGLAAKRRITLTPDGRADVILGRIRRRATLPPQLWPALLATDRLYSEQEIATLRTVVPMLQFARAKLSEFTDHGPNHAFRVKSFATQLGAIVGLSAAEQHLLRAGALFHDIGNVVDRQRHHIISQETVERLAADGELPFSRQEAALIGLLCRWHRRDYDGQRVDQLRGEPIRTGVLASILRVADAMDIDQRRSDHPPRFAHVLRRFFPQELPYWTSIEEILGVRIVCTPTVQLHVLTDGHIADNMQVAMLRKDVAGTPLPWSVKAIAVDDAPPAAPADRRSRQRAIVVFPFEPHSLVMAARSRVHLQAAGYQVESMCYPDTVGAPAWLWRDGLTFIDPHEVARLVVIGDRPDAAITPQIVDLIGRWHAAGAAVSVLNRHEANWMRVPQLLQRGAEVILGGDWAYFWGHTASRADLFWGRIAALCTRDPTQASVGITPAELVIAQGLLKAVYDAASTSAGDADAWTALAAPILERIATDDRAYFADEGAGFATAYTATTDGGWVDGRVVRFDRLPSSVPQACSWALEAAIERQGRTPERGIHFNVPYAIALWRDNDAAELLAINHWREEQAIPIRLLYPRDGGPPPEGNESAIRARLPHEQAERIVDMLVAACNRQ